MKHCPTEAPIVKKGHNMNDVYEKLNRIVEGYQEEMIDVLGAFIKIPSITEHRLEVKEALNFILDAGIKSGFRATSLLDREVGLIEMGQGEETLGILAHVDVVNGGDPNKWQTPPFEAALIEGKLFGRGAVDDKGPVVAALYAMKAVSQLAKDEKKSFFKKVQLILGTREEAEWTDMASFVSKYPLPDYGFTPDGEFPVCNIEKGAASITLHLPAAVDQTISLFEGGTAPNVVPGKCEAVVRGQKLESDGKAVHACQPEKGENAIMKMAGEILKMDCGESSLVEVASMLQDCFSDREGTTLGLRSESEFYNGEFVHRNIFTPTMIKATANGTRIVIDIRYAFGTEFDEIHRVFQELAQRFGGQIESFENLPPVYVSSGKPYIQAFARAYESVSGKKNEFALAYGGSYAKAMPNVVSWGPLFPGEQDTCHEENEYIAIESLMLNCKIFAAAIWEIALSPDSFQ